MRRVIEESSEQVVRVALNEAPYYRNLLHYGNLAKTREGQEVDIYSLVIAAVVVGGFFT